MPRLLSHSLDLAVASISKRTVTEGDLDNATLTENEEVTVYSKQIPEDKSYFWGHGPMSRDQASGFYFAQVKASGNGTNTDGNVIENADLIVAITDADQRRVLASKTVGTLGELNDAQGESNSDRPVLPALGPAAGPGRYIELRVRAKDSTAGGSEVASDSDVRIPFGEFYL